VILLSASPAVSSTTPALAQSLSLLPCLLLGFNNVIVCGSVMNPYWITGITLFALLAKRLPQGMYIARAAGGW